MERKDIDQAIRAAERDFGPDVRVTVLDEENKPVARKHGRQGAVFVARIRKEDRWAGMTDEPDVHRPVTKADRKPLPDIRLADDS